MKPVPRIATNVNILSVQHKKILARLRAGLRLVHRPWPKSHIAPTAVLCSWLCAGHPLAMATQTILIIYSDHVIIAADSLFTGAATPPRKGCKIRQSGSFFWTAGGVNSSADKRFDIDKLISDSAHGQLSTPEMLDHAGLRIAPALQREIPRLKREEPSFYNRAKATGTLLELIAARETGVGVEGYIKEFHISNDDKVSTPPARTCTRPGECRFYTSTAIRQYSNAHPEIWNADAVSTVNLLIGLAIDAEPLYSARPVSILQVAPNNTHWLQQNDCPNIQQKDSKESNPAKKKAH